MNILITGGTGFIGNALLPELVARGHRLTILSRTRHGDYEGRRFIQSLDELAETEPLDAVINLAGASLAGGRWTQSYKREIVESRLQTTSRLVDALQRLHAPPTVMLSASAIGYYGHGDAPVNETSPAGSGFSADLCRQWEDVARRAEALGTRVCLCRFGVVLDAGGGAFEALFRPFRFGVANWIGSGRQWMSWVHRADVVAALIFLLDRAELSGPFNITSPEPVTARDMCAAIKRYRRTLITAPVPAPIMRAMLGEMADELLIRGQRVVPDRLTASGFAFTYPALDAALANILKD